MMVNLSVTVTNKSKMFSSWVQSTCTYDGYILLLAVRCCVQYGKKKLKYMYHVHIMNEVVETSRGRTTLEALYWNDKGTCFVQYCSRDLDVVSLYTIYTYILIYFETIYPDTAPVAKLRNWARRACNLFCVCIFVRESLSDSLHIHIIHTKLFMFQYRSQDCSCINSHISSSRRRQYFDTR